jgi:tRNA 2-selenouridine synthase SelU
MDIIVDDRVTDTDAKPYQSRDPHKVLATQEREKKKKYLQSCLEQRKHFTPFVVFTDGFIGREAGELLKRFSLRLADKWERSYLVVRGFVSYSKLNANYILDVTQHTP